MPELTLDTRPPSIDEMFFKEPVKMIEQIEVKQYGGEIANSIIPKLPVSFTAPVPEPPHIDLAKPQLFGSTLEKTAELSNEDIFLGIAIGVFAVTLFIITFRYLKEREDNKQKEDQSSNLQDIIPKV